MRRALLVFFALAGCSHGIAVEGVRYQPPRQAVPVIPVQSFEIAVTADTVGHDAPRWASTSLGGEPWLMAGTDARPAHWYAYLSFELAALPTGTEIGFASLVLPIVGDPPMPGRDESAEFEVYAVAEPWNEADLVWARQPRVFRQPVAVFSVEREPAPLPGGADVVDVSHFVSQRVAAGATSISFAIVHRDPAGDFRRRWASRESVDGEMTPDRRVPTLAMTVGRPPPPATQAELDQLRRP